MSNRWLICGGRTAGPNFLPYVKEMLDKCVILYGLPQAICHGGAQGYDSLASNWAKERGYKVNESLKIYRADWTKGSSAGPIRNQQMLDDFKPDLVIAFPGNKGTFNMIKIAEAANVPVLKLPQSSTVGFKNNP